MTEKLVPFVRQNNPSLDELYKFVCETKSDIFKHIPRLHALAQECDTVIEMGTRWGASTIAFLHAAPKKLTCYDITKQSVVNYYQQLETSTDFQVITANTLTISIEETDLLFIDTLHTFDQLAAELELHADKAKKYIALHDTVTFGNKGARGDKGLIPAIQLFLKDNPHWKIEQDYKDNNGLMILKRYTPATHSNSHES